MTVVSKSPVKSITIIGIMFFVLSFIFLSTSFRGLLISPIVEDSELQKELQQRKADEMKRNRDRFSSLEEFENVLDCEALTSTDVEIPILNEPTKPPTNPEEVQKHSQQKQNEGETATFNETSSNSESAAKFYNCYSVQIAALSNSKSAEEMADQLHIEGFPVYIESKEEKNGMVLYRIRIGKYDARIDAENTLKELVETGRTGFVVRQ